MARRIYIKDGGLNTSPTIPPGYTALGTNGGELKKKVVDTISDIGGGGSSKTRVDVLSVGVRSGYGSSTFQANVAGLSGSNNLLWEVVDSNGNYLISDEFYTNISDLVSYVDVLSSKAGIDMTVKGYYYLDQSKEKFRITGRNLAYWSLVGLNNYSRMRDRGQNNIDISPGVLGENIITALNSYSSNTGYESLAYITPTGQGLAFSTSTKSNNICVTNYKKVPYIQNMIMGSDGTTGRTLFEHNTYGIDEMGSLVSLFGLNYVGVSTFTYQESLLVFCGRGGEVSIKKGLSAGVYPAIHPHVSLLQLWKLRVYTTEYPQGGPGSGLIVWYVRPIGQDTFLLNNNSNILSDDNVYLIPEDRYKNVFLPRLSYDIHVQLDNSGFGEDVSVDATKTALDRYRNIWVEYIPGFESSNTKVKNLKFNGQFSRRIKFRVAYGKLGNFTLSDDYIVYNNNKGVDNITFLAMVNK